MHPIRTWITCPWLTDFQIKELSGAMNHLQAFCQVRDSYSNNSDIFGIWESNLPIYFLPSIRVFSEIIHQCCANYNPVHRAVMSPSQIVIFYITVESINEMLQFHPTQPLAPLSMGFLLEQASQLKFFKNNSYCSITYEAKLPAPRPTSLFTFLVHWNRKTYCWHDILHLGI